MTRLITTLILFAVARSVLATEIKGLVKDENGEGLLGVNVYIKDTYDGATSGLDGSFSFSTTQEGEQILMATFVGYLPFEFTISLDHEIQLDIKMQEEVNRLSGVTITAGSFEASAEKKSVILKPLDVAMTAGALADIPAALNTLPGTTNNGESGRLFVRGGTSNETQAFIDGIKVHNFYLSTPQNIPSRSRFSPFLFKGTFFSTGGYSAEYGQALSSVLSLNSTDMPEQTQTDLSIMTVGLGGSHTQKWETGSVFGEVMHINLNPYTAVVEQETDWQEAYTSTGGTFMLRQQVGKSNMLKLYTNYDQSSFRAVMPSVNRPDGDLTDMLNKNLYLNSSYQIAVGENSSIYLGGSVGETSEDIIFNEILIKNHTSGYHVKSNLSTDIGQVSIKVGGEWIYSKETDEVTFEDASQHNLGFDNHLSSSFLEADYYITNNWTIRGGVRHAYYSVFDEHVLSPRLSMALKTGEESQVSIAYGKFHQLPQNDLLLKSTQVNYEQADHYMVSYQAIKNGRTIRGELYYKNYDDLVKFDPNDAFNPMTYNNGGHGYARGVDLFFRDSKTVENVDVWVSYSFLDTERDYQHYPYQVMPEFASKHNLSIVYKQFIPSIKIQLGASYNFNSGRPYNNPNEDEFNGEMTPVFSQVSFNCAYLFRPNIIFYTSISNLFGRDNVFGYDYADIPNANGTFDSMPIGQQAKRFFFVGMFITLSKDKTVNQLENL
ncbi:MAG: TonB-dependent receptor [Reichenbachiella sp.]